MVLPAVPNIDMTLAVKAKEQYLIGHYAASLDTFREVAAQIGAYSSLLERQMENGDPADFEEAEKQYSQWQEALQMLQEEFAMVKQIQETCDTFTQAPGGRANGSSHSASSSPFLSSRPMPAQQQQHAADAQLQAQHLAAQAATDIRDPDVWPPPTPIDPPPPRVRRTPSAGSGNWRVPSRTPSKPPASALSRENSQDPDEGASSARLPDWASGRKAAAAPAARPRAVRKVSHPTPSTAPSDPPPRRSRSSMAPARKPAVPTVGRKSSAAASSSKKKEETESEEGGRVKYEAATKEEQEMADMIEREILDKTPNVKMSDIAGLAGAKQLLTEAVVLPRLIPGYFTGKRKPWRGVLMFGPPGTGKTLLAKAVATECNTTFFSVSPSTVTSKYRGDSEKLMKLLFEMARFYAPSTIFMDEVDGLCSARGGGGEHEASRRVKGEILAQMDGATTGEYDPAKSVIVLGATNLPWELDTAFLRRFEKRVHIDLPDEEGRRAMFQINTEGMQVDEDAKEGGTWKSLVEMSDGYSGADIAVVCNDASMLGLRRLLAGKTPDEMKKMSKEEFNVPITRADFESVFATVKSSAGKNDLEKYREWMQEFGSAI